MSAGEWIGLGTLVLAGIGGVATLSWTLLLAQRKGDREITDNIEKVWARVTELERQCAAAQAALGVFKEFRDEWKSLLESFKRAP